MRRGRFSDVLKFTVLSDPLLSTCQMYRRSTTCEAQTSANTRCRNSTVNGMTLNKTAECECATFLRIPACSPSGFTWGGAVALPLALQHCQLTFDRMPQNIADYPKRSFQPRKPHGTLGHFAVPLWRVGVKRFQMLSGMKEIGKWIGRI